MNRERLYTYTYIGGKRERDWRERERELDWRERKREIGERERDWRERKREIGERERDWRERDCMTTLIRTAISITINAQHSALS